MTTISDDLYFAYGDSPKLKVLKRKQKNRMEGAVWFSVCSVQILVMSLSDVVVLKALTNVETVFLKSVTNS